jgi:endonuclease I
VVKQCGNYKVEGDCYNREHSFPKSWFNDQYPMYTDIHHLFATDGKVNNMRGNYPYGEVDTATYTSSNGSKLGAPTAELIAYGFTGDKVFEPIDEFKGDFARAYFYMATRYQDRIDTWELNTDNSNAVLDGSTEVVFEPWILAMLKKWHSNDPVSAKETYRNDAAFQFQGNRNPFIDHPEYVSEIWQD